MRFLWVILLAPLVSCSVYTASRMNGIGIEQLQLAQNRAELIELGAEPVTLYDNENGSFIETYRIPKEKGSTARAFMHSVLDGITLGLWEIVGTPIESALSKEEHYFVKVTFDPMEKIEHIELY